MKKLIITCAVIALGSVALFAQNARNASAGTQASRQTGPTAEYMAERQARSLEKQLGLNAEQYKAVYAAHLDYIQQDMAARANGQVPGEGQAMQMQMGKDQKIQAVLTAEQYAKYTKMKPAAANTNAAKH